MKSEAPRPAVLLVEDNLVLAQLLSTILRDAEYDVISVATSRDARRLVDLGEPFDLLVTDMHLQSETDGLDVAALVSERRPGTPVLIVTGSADLAKDRVGDRPFTVLQKPVAPADLLAQIRRALAT